MADRVGSAATEQLGRLAEEVPTDRLREQAQNLLSALGERAASVVNDKVTDAADRLMNLAENPGNIGLKAALGGGRAMAEGKSPLMAALGATASGVKENVKEKVKGVFGGGGKGKKGGGKKIKITNIVEDVDVGVPLRVAYNQWTEFGSFPTFMKKVESVDHESDEKSNWKAQVFWSHRTWQANIVKQVPDELIVWRSKGPKGHVDGAVTFHELSPTLTRILVVLEYHPQGLFERTGNLWRAQGRRARLELKHFRRHVMSRTLLDPESVEGWRGEIDDGEVVRTHEDAMAEEEEREREGPEGEEAEDEYEGEGEEEPPEEEAEDEEEEEEEPEGEGEEYDDEDEYDDEEEDEEEPPEEDELEDELEEERPRRR